MADRNGPGRAAMGQAGPGPAMRDAAGACGAAQDEAAQDEAAPDEAAQDEAAQDEAAQDEAVRLAAELIRIDTTNRGGGDARERPAAELVAAALSEAGLEPVLLESAPGRANVVARMTGA